MMIEGVSEKRCEKGTNSVQVARQNLSRPGNAYLVFG